MNIDMEQILFVTVRLKRKSKKMLGQEHRVINGE